MKRLLAAPAIVALLAAIASAQVSGWRGDGTGKYPDATPPTEWARFPKSPVHGMLSDVNKPAGAEPGRESRPLEFNYVREWLLIGPFDPAEKDPLDKEYLPGEADLQPSEGDKSGDLEWKRVTLKKRDADPNQGTDPDWIYFGDLTGKKNERFACAHAYVWAPTEGKALFVFDHAAALKVCVNGKSVYSSPKASLSMWAQNNIGWAMGNYYPTPFGVKARKVSVTLAKGWNRVLLKANANVHLRITAEPDAEYESKNVVWAAKLPDISNSSPVIAGGKLFVMADPDELVCVDKATGRVLWRRSNSFLDTVPVAERAANPAYAKVAELTEKRLATESSDEKMALRKQILDALAAIDKDRFAMSVEAHPTGHRPVAGWTSPGPWTDGKLVWCWVTNGVAACYDLDGNRKWITRVDLLLRDPKEKFGPYNYPCSPALVGGKFVCAVVYHGMVALDAATGAPAWVNRDVKSSLIHLSGGNVGGTDVVIDSGGEVIRAADGKVLWTNKWNSGTGPAVFENPVLYLQYLGYVAIDFSKCRGEDFKAATVRNLNAPALTTYGAPLENEGLLYYAGREGELAVVDVQAGKTVYRKPLGVMPLMNYNAAGMCSAPTLGGKNVYLFDNQGTGIVLAPGREYKELSRNRIETLLDRDYPTAPQETFYSNPVFEGTRFYLRGERYLYCIGEQ